MKPLEFIASEDLFSVYMKCHWHPYFDDLSKSAGGKMLGRNAEWIATYKLPMGWFLKNYRDLAEGSPIVLDDFLEGVLGNNIKPQAHSFNLPMLEPRGILPEWSPEVYQLESFSHAWHHKRSIVALPVGSGKSLVGKMFKEMADIPFTLIVPASITYQWKAEIKKFTGKEAMVVQALPKKRHAQYKVADEFEWLIINYEKLASDGALVPKRKGVIIDEAHYLKNPDSKRTKAVTEYIKDCDYVLLLSGTFLVNSLLDGWSLMNMLKLTNGQNFYMFKKYNCILDKYDTPVAYKPSIGKFKRELKAITYYRSKEELMPDLPERRDTFVDIHMEKDQEEYYTKAVDGILKDLLDPQKEKEMSPAAQFTRLRQMSADPRICFPEIDSKRKLSAKIDWIDNFIQEFDDRVMIIYSPFDTFLRQIITDLPNNPWVHIHGGVPMEKREKMIEDARHSKERSFFLITDAMQTGKNIQFCQHFIFTTLPLTWAGYDQPRGRVWRKGQELPVNIYHLMGLNTIDHANWDLVQSKSNLMSEGTINRFTAKDLRDAIQSQIGNKHP